MDDFQVFTIIRPTNSVVAKPKNKLKSTGVQSTKPINRDFQNVLDARPTYIKHFSSNLMDYGVNPGVLDMLISKKTLDVSIHNSMALRVACKMGIISSVVKLINLGSDPAANNNQGIVWASENGYDDIVSLLLLQYNVDPSVESNKAYILAVKYGHTKVQKVLLRDSRVSGLINGTDKHGKIAATYIY